MAFIAWPESVSVTGQGIWSLRVHDGSLPSDENEAVTVQQRGDLCEKAFHGILLDPGEAHHLKPAAVFQAVCRYFVRDLDSEAPSNPGVVTAKSGTHVVLDDRTDTGREFSARQLDSRERMSGLRANMDARKPSTDLLLSHFANLDKVELDGRHLGDRNELDLAPVIFVKLVYVALDV